MTLGPNELREAMRRHRWWEDKAAPAQSVRQGANAPTWDTTEVGWLFANAPPANQEIQGNLQLPHRWAEGSSLRAHIHWYLTVAGAANEDVKWDLLYRVASIGGTFPAGWTTLEQTVDVSAYAIREHLYTEWTAIAVPSETISMMLDFRVQRDTADAADDHEQDVILKEFDIHYEIDSLGSWEELTKWG